MLNTYNTCLSGMLAASHGLQNASHNIANMQSPGYKRSDLFYSCLGNSGQGLGSGVSVGGEFTNFSDGKYLSTGNVSDLAIVGQGFFVVKQKNGELLYTRDGEFVFNKEGYLVDRHSQGFVQGYDKKGQLLPICQKGPKTCPGKLSSYFHLKGKFHSVLKSEEELKEEIGPLKSLYRNISFDIPKVYDKDGKAHNISISFKTTPVEVKPPSSDPNLPATFAGITDYYTWQIDSISCDGQKVDYDSTQELVFLGTNTGLEPDKSKINFSLNGNPITLDFGNYKESSESKMVKLSNEPNDFSVVEVEEQDGYPFGKQSGFSFTNNGQISYEYDNGQNLEGIFIALARFDDLEHDLSKAQSNLFRAKTNKGRHLGWSNQNGLGTVVSKQIETANVDSTMEFANIVVLQRMFQSCSQIMNIDKELLEGLYKR